MILMLQPPFARPTWYFLGPWRWYLWSIRKESLPGFNFTLNTNRSLTIILHFLKWWIIKHTEPENQSFWILDKTIPKRFGNLTSGLCLNNQIMIKKKDRLLYAPTKNKKPNWIRLCVYLSIQFPTSYLWKAHKQKVKGYLSLFSATDIRNRYPLNLEFVYSHHYW